MITTSVFHCMFDGDGITTAFPFTFHYDNSDDIMVVLIDEDTTETVLTSDYYVNTVNNTVYYPGYAPGAEPPLADQPPVLAVGQKLMVYRKTPVTQVADLGEKWPFATIEGGLDKLTMILQETSYDVNCALRVSDATSMAAGDDLDLEIPIEAGKTLIGNSAGTGYETATALLKDGSVWDADGLKISNVADPVASTDVATKGYVDAATMNYTFDSVADMRAGNLSVGVMAHTSGYYTVDDGGAGVYKIRANASDTDDGGKTIVLNNGNVAELITDGDINVRQCGAKGDGVTDDGNAIKVALDYGSGTVFFPPGTYAVAGYIRPKKGAHLIGSAGTTLLKTNNNTSFVELGKSDITIEGFTITQNTNRAAGKTTSLVLIHSTAGASIAHIRVTNCIICDAAMYGVNIQDSSYYVRDVKIDHCHIYNVNVGVKNGGGYTRDVSIDSCNIHYTLGECVTFDGTVQFSSLTNCVLYSNDAGVGLVGCDHSSYITITGNRFSQTGSSGTATLLRGITFNRHMGICNGYVVNGNVFVSCYYGVYCKQAETDSQGTWPYNGVKNLVCTDNVFINSVAGDIRIDNIEGDNDFRCNVSTDRSKLYVLLSAHEAEIRAKSRFDS